MILSDPRPIREQVWSGLRLAASIVLCFIVVMMLLASSSWLMSGQSRFSSNQLFNRFLGGSGLILLGAFLFFTAHLWVEVFAAIAARFVLVGVVGLLLFFPQSELKKTSRTEFAGQVCLAAAILALSFKYFNREPSKVEAIGLTGTLVSFSIGIVQRSFVPPVAGIGWLALMQAIN